ncbi:alcohol dehydrogenase-like protein [Cercophora newfieldiana]|uniref:Alcohol dehydrogenase-like protein n=1 Tax=Cercophora newfieldiana TaxID=92897 RepID=A0AA40CUB5_9PEZI|nr:alcohol dehydrogenase-like protein [Cercophora newfieldiana]
MKEAVVSKGTKVEIIDSPIPTPNDDQVLIKVIVSGSNPKDWKLPDIRPVTINQGDDITGIVEKVGASVFEFQPGDRVAAFHEMMTPHGSYAEYAIAWAHTTFHIPAATTFEEAATLPLAAMTAAVGLYQRLGLPHPWDPLPPGATTHRDIPLVIYGGASAVGIFAIQLALRSNIHPLICVAGRAKEYVASFLDPSKGDVVIDYRQPDEDIIGALRSSVPDGQPIRYALDAVAEKGSPQILGAVLQGGSGSGSGSGDKAKVTFVLHGEKDIPAEIEQSITRVGCVHQEAKDFGYVYYRYMAKGLGEGWFKGQRTEVVEGGLGGVQKALEDLKAGRASGVKYVFRIGETEGVERD